MTISSLIFSFIQLGLFGSQIALFKKYRSEEMVRFILMTVLFLILNFTLIFISYDDLDSNLFKSINTFNAVTIAFYLFFLNFEPLVSSKSRIKKTPWLLVSVAIAFGVHGIIVSLPYQLVELEESLFLLIPLLLSAKLVALAIRKSNSIINKMLSRIGMLIVGVIVIGSFKKYLSNEPWLIYSLVNIIFLLFASFQYKTILNSKKTIRIESDSESEESVLKSYALSSTELVIAEFILKGYNYEQIAEIRNRSYSSVSSQASNSFKKVGVKNLDEFREKFNKTIDK